MENDDDDEIAPEHAEAFAVFSEWIDTLERMGPAREAVLARRQAEQDRRREVPANVKRARKATLVSVAKQAEKAGLAVARYEIDPDGKITIVTGTPDDGNKPANDLDVWMAKHNAH